MDTPYEFAAEAEKVVYVKTVAATSLPKKVQAQLDGAEQLYAVHNAEGQQLALVGDRNMAFVLARQNDFTPVAVH